MTELFNSTGPVILEPKERIKRFGIECIGPAGDGIVFLAGHWKPGGEYIQKLIVRNVSTSVKHLKYKLPSTRYFSLAYPEEIVLSPGMFKELDVVFRPVHNDPYDDTIYFKMLEGKEVVGGFHVPVRAWISKLQVTAPFGLDFGFCSTHQTTTQTFLLTNSGEVESPFRWEAAEPFVITPVTGSIPVGKSLEITVRINPQAALVFMVHAVCIVGEGVHAIIPEPKLVTRFSAIAKFAYISLSESKIDFGEVLSGTPPNERPQEVLLRNSSVVPAEFECYRHDNDRDEVFDVFPRKGIVPARGEITVKVKFSALSSGNFSTDLYTFRTPGNCRTTLTCTGLSMPPVIVFRKQLANGAGESEHVLDANTLQDGPSGAPMNFINFGEVEIGYLTTRIFFLKNTSARDTVYSIVADENGVFQMEPRQGVIPAGMEASVKLTFSPHHPINYYRRIWILIGEALPMFYDACGNGFIRAHGEVKEQRPAPLRHAHIQAYRNRCVLGKGDLSPDELDALYDDMISREDGSYKTAPEFAHVGVRGTMALSVASIRNPLTRTGDSSRAAVAVAHELFVEPTDPTGCQGVTLDTTYLDFGYAPCTLNGDGLAHQYVTLTNHTRGKVAVVWCVPKVHSDKHDEELSTKKLLSSSVNAFEKPPPESAFIVTPSSAEIGSKKTMKFKVSFIPRKVNRNYVNEIEAVTFFKNQRTFRLVNDHTLTPPWTLGLHTVGHTFESGQLLAKARLLGGAVRNGKLTFPHCFLGDSIFQTIRLKNASNLPSTFRFEMGFVGNTVASAAESVFSVRPEAGEIAPEDFVLICIRFSPKVAHKKNIQLLRCIVNGAVGGQVLLEGAGGFPAVVCPDVLSLAIVTGNELLPIDPPETPSGFQGVFYMKPTAVGLSSTRVFRIKNCSRLPLRFSCHLPSTADGILSISPNRGMLKGNEECEATIFFAPQVPEELVFKLRISVYPIGGDAPRVIDCRQPGKASMVNAIQHLSVNITAPGSGGAILFDPPAVATPVQLVKTTEKKDIVIENVSESDLYYELFYGLKFYLEESTGAGSSTKPPVVFGQERVEAGPTQDEFEEHRCIYCNKPSGIIPAKSRSIVTFSVNPNRAGLFEFSVSCRLRTIGENGEPDLVPNEQDVLLRMGVTTRAGGVGFGDVNEEFLTMSPDIIEDPDKALIPRRKPNRSNQNFDLPLVAEIVSRASFPTVMFEDIRVEHDSLICDVEQLWRQFSLAPLNKELQLPLTDDEVAFNSLSSPNLEKLSRFSFNFTPDVIGAPRQTLTLRLRNNGFLTTSFRLHLPNEKELELEPWCDEDEPTPERLMQVCILEELKSFEIEPRQGTLLPGDTCTIRVGYSHNSLKYGGIHKLPILMRVAQGKQFWIDVIGQTLGTSETARAQIATPGNNPRNLELAPETILLKAFTDPQSSMWLQNVPLGLPIQSAPVQRIVLVNVGATDASFEIDSASLRDATSENLNIEILKVFNPRGVITARSTYILEVAFFPLEAKEYSIPLVVRYFPKNFNEAGPGPLAPGSKGGNRKKSMMLNLHYLNINVRCLGYHPRVPKPLTPHTDFRGALPPARQLLDIGNFMAISEDIVDFGIVPQKTEASRVIILKNISDNRTVDFFIDDASCGLLESGLLTIQPAYGRTLPGESVVLNLLVKSDTCTSIIEERFLIVTQEVITAKKAVRGNRLKERLKSNSSKRVGSESHSSIVSRTTFTRSMQVELTSVPNGRVAKLPGTVVGSVTFSGGNNQDEEGMATPGKSLMSKTDGGVSFLSVKTPAASLLSQSQSIAYSNSNVSNAVSQQGSLHDLASPTPSVASPGGKTPSTRMGGMTAFSDMNSISSGFTGHSSARSGPQTLLGPRVSLNVRVKCAIYESEIISKTLQVPGNQEEPELLKTYIMPRQQPFVGPKALRPGSAFAAVLPMGGLDENSDELSVGSRTSKAGGLAGVPADQRQTEARSVISFVLFDLFIDLVSSYETETEISEKLLAGFGSNGLTMVRSPDSGGAVALQPVGTAKCGVYLAEVRPDIPTVDALIDYCAAEKLFVSWETVKADIHQMSSAKLLKQSSVMNSIDGIGFQEDLVYIPSPSEYFVPKQALMQIILDLGLKRKGLIYGAIKSRLNADKYNYVDVKNDFFPKLDRIAVEKIGRNLVLMSNKKKLSEKLSRQSLSSKQELADAAIRIQNAMRKKIATKTVEKKRTSVAQSKAKQAEIAAEKERQLLRKKKRDLTAEEKLAQEQQLAAEKIQSIARARSARSQAEKANESSIEEKAVFSLCNEPGFFEMAGELMRNTMFNIIQEAVHGEFVIDSEPLKFVVKRDDFFDNSDDEGSGSTARVGFEGLN